MEALNKILSKYILQGAYPGIQWQINVRDKIYTGKIGFNNIELKEPVRDDSIYRVWSMTKPIVAVAAMQLLDQDKINLNDPITKYLSEFSNLKVLKNQNSKIDEIEDLKKIPTIKDLLLHTAGFSYNFLEDPIGKQYDLIKLFSSNSTSLEEEIKILSSVPLLFQPGTSWRYSVSMDVLGRIIEIINADSLQNILKKNIFDPLGMTETDFLVPDQKTSRLMKSYEFDLKSSKLFEIEHGAQKIANYGYPLNEKNFARGGHGLYSTLNDYAIFIKMLHTGKSNNGVTIVSKDSLKLMTSNLLIQKILPIEILSVGTVKDNNYRNDLEGYGWGCGFRTLIDINKNNNLGSIGEFGWAGAASTYFLVDNKKELSALLMTQVLSGVPTLKKDFYEFIYTNL